MTNQITTTNSEIRTLAPTDLIGLIELAKIMIDSGFLPKHITKPSQLVLLSQAGAAVGLTMLQSVQGFMMVNDKPAPYGDTPLSIVRASGVLAYIKEEIVGHGKDMKAVCTVLRKGEKLPIIREFSVDDATIAKLWGKAGPWSQYPKRMLQMRARTFALRDGFSDKLNGISYTAEELQDSVMVDVTPHETAPTVYDNPLVETMAPPRETIMLYGTEEHPAKDLPITEVYSYIRTECEAIQSVQQYDAYYSWWRLIYVQVKDILTKDEVKELGEIFFPKKKLYGEKPVAEAA